MVPTGPTDTAVTYQVQANYGPNNSLSSAPSTPQSPLDQTLAVQTAIVRGPQGRLYLVAPNIPPGVAWIRVFPTSSGVNYPYDFFNDYGYRQPQTNFTANLTYSAGDVLVSSFSQGSFRLPNSFLPPFGKYTFQCRPFGTNGHVGPAAAPSVLVGSFGPTYVPFMDGSEHLRENLAFWLEAADESGPFQFAINDNTFPQAPTYLFTSGYAYANYHFTLDFGTPFDKIAFIDEFKPFEDNYYLRNFIYSPTNLNPDGSLGTGSFLRRRHATGAHGHNQPFRLPGVRIYKSGR